MIKANEYGSGEIKLPVYSSTSVLVAGEGLIWGNDGAAVDTNSLILSANAGADVFAVALEVPTTQTTNVQTPVVYQALVQIIQPVNIWKIYYDLTASTDLDITSSSSTIVTTAAHDDNADGGWIYINSGTGAGQLRYISGADGTTWTVSSAFTTTPDSTSDCILIRHVGIHAAGGNILNSDRTKLLAQLDGSATSEIIVLKNFIEGPFGRLELDPTLNSILTSADNLNTRGVRFSSLVVFSDTKISAKG